MDRQATIGFVLIALVLFTWMWLNAPGPQQPPSQADSVLIPRDTAVTERTAAPERTQSDEADTLGVFARLAHGTEKILIVRTKNYTAELTTRGALVRKWELADHRTWSGYPVSMVDFSEGGDFSLLFTTAGGKFINTRWLFFDADFKNWQTETLSDDDSVSIEMVLAVSDSQRIVKRFVFRNGSYGFNAKIEFVKMEQVIANYRYEIAWEHGVPFVERNSVSEAEVSLAYAYAGDELIELDASEAGVESREAFTGETEWVASRNKYFAVAMVPRGNPTSGFELIGEMFPQPNQGVKKRYSMFLTMPFRGNTMETAHVDVFLGPLDFDAVSSVHEDLDRIMSLGAAWIIRPISEYVMLPLFSALKAIIPNFGVVIIVFSIIIKIALNPLSKASMKSMKRMQALQPLMEEIRTKYKDEPEKMNQQIMNLYRDYGVNPAAGCLPLLLQMPILYALWAVFSSAIELRHAHFALWITDLSTPDILFTVPVYIPIAGNEISGLALAMGLTMLIQQKMTVTDPRQKMMVWLMPIMLTLLFNSFPSGLNLYYFVFNLLSIGQQMLLKRNAAEEPLRKVDFKNRRPGLLERLAQKVPKQRR